MADGDEWVTLGEAARRVGRRPQTILRWARLYPIGLRKLGGRWQVEATSLYTVAGTPLMDELERLRARVDHLEHEHQEMQEYLAAIPLLKAQLQQLLPPSFREPLQRPTQVARFLERHIDHVRFTTLLDWKDMPLDDGHAALVYAVAKTVKAKGRGKGRIVHQCHIPGCPCHSMDLPLLP